MTKSREVQVTFDGEERLVETTPRLSIKVRLLHVCLKCLPTCNREYFNRYVRSDIHVRQVLNRFLLMFVGDPVQEGS